MFWKKKKPIDYLDPRVRIKMSQQDLDKTLSSLKDLKIVAETEKFLALMQKSKNNVINQTFDVILVQFSNESLTKFNEISSCLSSFAAKQKISVRGSLFSVFVFYMGLMENEEDVKIRRNDFVNDVLCKYTSSVKILYGSINGYIVNIGTFAPMSLSGVIPDALDLLDVLNKMSFGAVKEMNPLANQ